MEFVGTLPLFAFAALACLQALALAITLLLAQHSVDRAAQPHATQASVERSLPAAWRSGAKLRRHEGLVELRLEAPRLLPGTGRLLHVRATAPEVAQ